MKRRTIAMKPTAVDQAKFPGIEAAMLSETTIALSRPACVANSSSQATRGYDAARKVYNAMIAAPAADRPLRGRRRRHHAVNFGREQEDPGPCAAAATTQAASASATRAW